MTKIALASFALFALPLLGFFLFPSPELLVLALMLGLLPWFFMPWGSVPMHLGKGGQLRRQIQTGRRSLAQLSWSDLERVVAASYAKYGWKVALTGTSTKGGSDGGVDVLLTRGADKCLVSCKQWKGRVGVKHVREMLGLMIHHQAKRGVIVATGGFTQEVWSFVKGKPIDLISGPRLQALIDGEASGDVGAEIKPKNP